MKKVILDSHLFIWCSFDLNNFSFLFISFSSLLQTALLPFSGVSRHRFPFWVPGVLRLSDAAGPAVAHQHGSGWSECGSRTRSGGEQLVRLHALSGDQHGFCWCLAHPGVWLQPTTQPEHWSVSRGRCLHSKMEVHGEHSRLVTAQGQINLPFFVCYRCLCPCTLCSKIWLNIR